jgi:hypothetical protein
VGYSGGLSCLGGDITHGDARGGTLVGSRGMAVTSLKETRGLLSRFDYVYSDYITQGCPGGALAVAMSLRARCLFFPTHFKKQLTPQDLTGTGKAKILI